MRREPFRNPVRRGRVRACQSPLVFCCFDADTQRAGQLGERLYRRGLVSERLLVTNDQTATQVLPSDLAILVVDPAGGPAQAGQLSTLLKRLVSERVATLVCGAPDDLKKDGGPLVEWADPDAGVDELVGKVGTLTRYAPLIKGFERELTHLQRLGEQLNHYFNDIDQEMRLAGRLQRDFLPRQLPEIAPYSFQVAYRPASWVSGDLYDVFRIDEHHIGMFVADAMGHGVAAGLLTMFLRQALVAKQVAGDSYSIVTPAEALGNLHDCLVRQKLPNCQFVTAAYGIIDTRGGELHVARAGHPYPLLISPAGDIQEVRTDGSLLGLADLPAEFEETRVSLSAGDKIIFYTDGIEDIVAEPRLEFGERTAFTREFKDWARQPVADFMTAVQDHLDCREGSLHPADDVTLLALEVATASD